MYRGTEIEGRRARQVRILGMVAACSVLVGGVILIVKLSQTHKDKVVHVVIVTRPATVPKAQQPRHPLRTRRHGSPPTLPPASAGTNGSYVPPSATSSLLKPGATLSFARLSASLPGQVDVALLPLGRGGGMQLGGDSPAHGWSTTKVPVLVALLRSRGAQGLTSTEQGWAHLAITESDNQSILDLFGDLERQEGGLEGASQYVQSLFRRSGDEQTIVATAAPPPGAVTTFGQTLWTPGDAVKFFRAFANECLIPRAQTTYVLGLMQSIIPSESWGLGSAGFSVPAAFKGGWGPEPSGAYLVRQSGIIDPGSSRGVAVSLVAYPHAGGDSFAAGTEMLTRTARWLRDELQLRSRPPARC